MVMFLCCLARWPNCLFQLLNIVLIIFELVCKKAHCTGVYGCSSFLLEMSDDFITLIVIRTLQMIVCCGSCHLMSDPHWCDGCSCKGNRLRASRFYSSNACSCHVGFPMDGDPASSAGSLLMQCSHGHFWQLFDYVITATMIIVLSFIRLTCKCYLLDIAWWPCRAHFVGIICGDVLNEGLLALWFIPEIWEMIVYYLHLLSFWSIVVHVGSPDTILWTQKEEYGTDLLPASLTVNLSIHCQLFPWSVGLLMNVA